MARAPFRPGPRAAGRRRVRARVTGTVQGVGFRPFVFRLAEELGLGGFVLNDERGVELEVEGEAVRVDEFLRRVRADAPPLASVESVEKLDVDPAGESEFHILASGRTGAPEALVSADTATCGECLAELLDARDRRYRYPFINCTNCGPRFTIVRAVPYDRPRTTMAGFQMCPACRAEYDDPRDRRFHAQPNACPACGPRVWLCDAAGTEIEHGAEDAIAGAAASLRDGAILAVKGIGGYHLACLAGDAQAVAALRSRKHREDKPFAICARDLAMARELVELTTAEGLLMTGRQRPIVIARRRPSAAVAAAVAPRSADLGVMLPYSPLHHLLCADSGRPLVLTSGNVSDEPIAYRDDDARKRLAGIADAFLVHDRPIHTRTDDSVVRSLGEGLRRAPLVIRRSRGYVPETISLRPTSGREILACGAELKSTFCLAKGERAWVGHHIGDLKNYETLRSFTEGIDHFERLFAVTPEVVAHDLHPDYLSTRYALEREGVEHVGVQHHHAHLAACLAEHGVEGAAVGAIYDGSGLGADGTVWGGEILAGDTRDFSRVGALLPVRLPGGDAAVREPWRMACAWLSRASDGGTPAIPSMLREEVSERDWEAVGALVRAGTSSPFTTSAGRLFDAVAALCGVRARVNHEGQAAAELEGLTRLDETLGYPIDVVAGKGEELVLDAREAIRRLSADLDRGTDIGTVGARFHNGLAVATAAACAAAAEARGLAVVVLSGGVFQNRLLLERVSERLVASGLQVLLPERLPPNDGGISYGQAAVAAHSQ